MRPVSALGAYLVVVFIGAALMAPWVYQLVQSAAHTFPYAESLARHPFHRYVNRCLLVLAVLGLWPLFRQLGFRSRESIFGDRRWWVPAELAAGVAAGIGMISILGAAAWLFDARVFRPELTLDRFVSRTFSAAVSAVVVGILEETLFRGVVFRTLRRGHSPATALIWSSLFYAFVHFFRKPPRPAEVEWHTGFAVLGQMLSGWVDAEALVPGLLTLTMAGAILAIAVEIRGRLDLAIGIHAGWVFAIKLFNALLEPRDAATARLWGGRQVFDGWIGLGLLVIAALLLWRVRHRRCRPQACPAEHEPVTPR